MLPNSSEITGYNGDIKNYKIDLFGNSFFTTDNAIYKVNVGTTNAIEINKFNIGEVSDLIFDNKGNFYFTIKTSDEDNKLYKVNVGTTNAIEITDIGNGKFNNFKFDSKNNLYFTNESNLFIFNNEKHHYQLTDFKGNTDYVFFTFDSTNNLYFGIKNNNETIDLYKELYDEQKLIKIDDDVQNYEFTWKEQDNINFDNENNLYYVKKNNNEQLSIFYLKNNELKSQFVFTFNKVITKFNFKIKNNIIFAIIDDKIYKVDKFNLPIPPTKVNVATLILITSSIGCLIIGVGLLGYFIYYDRKHHVVKKWWEKRKEEK